MRDSVGIVTGGTDVMNKRTGTMNRPSSIFSGVTKQVANGSILATQQNFFSKQVSPVHSNDFGANGDDSFFNSMSQTQHQPGQLFPSTARNKNSTGFLRSSLGNHPSSKYSTQVYGGPTAPQLVPLSSRSALQQASQQQPAGEYTNSYGIVVGSSSGAGLPNSASGAWITTNKNNKF
jgi:hypothetical protein